MERKNPDHIHINWSRSNRDLTTTLERLKRPRVSSVVQSSAHLEWRDPCQATYQ